MWTDERFFIKNSTVNNKRFETSFNCKGIKHMWFISLSLIIWNWQYCWISFIQFFWMVQNYEYTWYLNLWMVECWIVVFLIVTFWFVWWNILCVDISILEVIDISLCFEVDTVNTICNSGLVIFKRRTLIPSYLWVFTFRVLIAWQLFHIFNLAFFLFFLVLWFLSFYDVSFNDCLMILKETITK